jgi:group I intron endonuclease
MQNNNSIIDMYKTGIYKITNTNNSKFYIGSAAISFKKRYNDHISSLKNNKHRNRHLQHSFKKYGLDCFIFEIIEICKEEIIAKEQYYIDTLNPHYNIARNVTSPMLGRKMNEESLARMSKFRKGKKFSKEHIEALSKVRKGFDSPKRREVREKMHKKQRIKIEAIDLTTNEITQHNSIHECSINLGLDATCISRVLSGKNGRSQHNGYTFRYVNKENTMDTLKL